MKKMVISFEISPIQSIQKIQSQKKKIDQLCSFNPNYISCSISGIKDVSFERNLEMCKLLKLDKRTVPMTHFAIGGKKKKELTDRLKTYVSIGIEHYFVIRGDSKYHSQRNDAFPNSFSFIKTIKKLNPDMHVSVAGYPETHILADSVKTDIKHLKLKQEFGADKIITQICFDGYAIANWLDLCQKNDIHLPVDISILPVTNKNSILQISFANGISIPKELSKIIGRYGDDPQDFKKAGIDYTIKQIDALKKLGINGFHFLGGNNTSTISEVLNMASLANNN